MRTELNCKFVGLTCSIWKLWKKYKELCYVNENRYLGSSPDGSWLGCSDVSGHRAVLVPCLSCANRLFWFIVCGVTVTVFYVCLFLRVLRDHDEVTCQK